MLRFTKNGSAKNLQISYKNIKTATHCTSVAVFFVLIKNSLFCRNQGLSDADNVMHI